MIYNIFVVFCRTLTMYMLCGRSKVHPGFALPILQKSDSSRLNFIIHLLQNCTKICTDSYKNLHKSIQTLLKLLENPVYFSALYLPYQKSFKNFCVPPYIILRTQRPQKPCRPRSKAPPTCAHLQTKGLNVRTLL